AIRSAGPKELAQYLDENRIDWTILEPGRPAGWTKCRAGGASMRMQPQSSTRAASNCPSAQMVPMNPRGESRMIVPPCWAYWPQRVGLGRLRRFIAKLRLSTIRNQWYVN